MRAKCDRADGCHGGPGAAEPLWNRAVLKFHRAYALRVRFLLTLSTECLSLLSKQGTTSTCYVDARLFVLAGADIVLHYLFYLDGKNHGYVSLVSTVQTTILNVR